MSIICFEGPSAVGKTTTSTALEASTGAYVVPEVNQLFSRPKDEPPEWYFERQLDRWSITVEQSKIHQLVILDGDPFQPLWYNWAYNFIGWQELGFLERFYKPRIQTGEIGFPDLYIILSASEEELRQRRAGDVIRRRRGFATHLKLIEPQRRYFEVMKCNAPNRVQFLQAERIEKTVKFVRSIDRDLIEKNENYSTDLLDAMIYWLRANEA